MSRDRTNPSSRPSWLARNRFAVVAGVTAFLVAVSGGASWAYFTANATATGSVTTQTVSVSQTDFNTLGATYLPSSLTSTGSFKITNTGAVTGTASATIAAPEAWASGLPIRVWSTAVAACNVATPPTSASSGTWAAPPAISVTLSAGASITYCVRTSIADWTTITSANGIQQANPVINVSLNASGWVATAPTATHVQQTAGMYNLAPNFFDPALSRWFTIRANANTNICLDVEGSGSSGTDALSYGCHANSNQRWEFLPVTGVAQNLVTIRPRHAPGTRLTYNGTTARIMTAVNGATAQRWYVQQTNTGKYQLVNAATGLCLSMSTSSGADATTVACNLPAAQLVFQREPLTFTGPNGLPFSDNIQIIFGGSNIPASTLERCTNAPTCTTWTSQASIANGSTSVSFTASTFTNNTYRIVSSGYVLWDGIRISCSGSWLGGYTCTPHAGFG